MYSTEGPGTCEMPQPPSWIWRYNRNKHLSQYQPWDTRVDQWHPRYRHMGVPYGFQFRLTSSAHAPSTQLGVTYAKHLNENRETGFGNAGLGNPPGPAPPRLSVYNNPNTAQRSELYAVNQVAGCSGGMSLWDNSYLPPDGALASEPPMDPREYLQATLGQTIEYPGTFPYLNIPQEPNTSRCCVARGDDVARAPLDIWMARHKANLRGHLTERSGRSATSILPAIPTPLSARPQTSALITHHTGEGARRNAYPLSNW